MLILSVIRGQFTRQLDFVTACPQADTSQDPVHVAIPKGYEFSCCLHVLKNIYIGQDAGRTWGQYLVKGLSELVIDQSQSDGCVFYQEITIFMVYVGNGILIDSKINETMSDLRSKCKGQDKGDLNDYLGVKVRKPPECSTEFVQLQLIDSILEDLKLVEHDGGNQASTPDTTCKDDSKMNRDEIGNSEYVGLAKSRMGCVKMYHACPILWASRLQSAFAVTTMVSKYVTLLMALWDVLSMMDHLKELQDRGYHTEGTLYIKCNLFAGNHGVFKSAKTAKCRPRTRYINAVGQHFWSYVATGFIQLTLFEPTGSLGTPYLSKSPRQTLLNCDDSYSGATISPSNTKILGFCRD
jgi:Reverse transcriptase (RNA-dependent DNA polymerase)